MLEQMLAPALLAGILASSVAILGTSSNCVAQIVHGHDFEIERSAVQVVNRTAELFSGEPGGGHGTGFIFEIVGDKGRVFTNNHVIASDWFEAQKLNLNFSIQGELPESVPATVVFKSRVHDFAVLEFNIKDLNRARKIIRPVKTPDSKKDPRYDFERNFRQLSQLPVSAYGFPLDGKEITTIGYINGIERDPLQGPLIQTQTPINPGNSGGPLIDLTDGTVIGINTLKLDPSRASNIGYAVPIGILIDEYLAWKKDPKLVEPHEMPLALFRFVNSEELAATDNVAIINEAIPNYFRRVADSMIGVRAAAASTKLQAEDLILAVNGEAIGDSLYRLRRCLQGEGRSAAFTLIRKHKVMTVEVPLSNVVAYEKRAQLDFVYLSGMVFHQMPPFAGFLTNPEQMSQVVLGNILETSESNFQSLEFPPPGSVVTGLFVGDAFYPIKTLLDLKQALNLHRDAKFVRLSVLPTRMVLTERGAKTLTDPRYGVPLMDAHSRTYVVPVSEVITPLQFSVHQFSQNFGFSSTDFASRDWRKFVRPFSKELCEGLLK